MGNRFHLAALQELLCSAAQDGAQFTRIHQLTFLCLGILKESSGKTFALSLSPKLLFSEQEQIPQQVAHSTLKISQQK